MYITASDSENRIMMHFIDLFYLEKRRGSIGILKIRRKSDKNSGIHCLGENQALLPSWKLRSMVPAWKSLSSDKMAVRY